MVIAVTAFIKLLDFNWGMTKFRFPVYAGNLVWHI